MILQFPDPRGTIHRHRAPDTAPCCIFTIAKGSTGLLKKVSDIVDSAAKLIVEHEALRIGQKSGHANFVTSVDSAVQEYLEDRLTALIPGSAFMGEEKENQSLGNGATWIVDPVDGTTNLIHDYRCSAISVALTEHRKPVLGIICQPYSKEMFAAESGKGATLNGRPIHVSNMPFEKALVSAGTAPYNEELMEKSCRLAYRFLRDTADTRRNGTAAVDLAYVACGRISVFYELRLYPWDYAAGALLITEAGGRFEMPFLDYPDYGATDAVLAASAVCYDNARRIFDEVCKTD